MSPRLRSRRLTALLATALAAALAVVAIAAAAQMTSTKLSPTLCETTGGGKFVAIPGFPGEMIDRRLLADIRWLSKRYPIFITDGYSMSDVHSEQGEHPLGLALDIVPDKAGGGRWADITRLARWAEPKQNQPRAPFRWVGYNGDSGHGRGDHLHLSWGHSETTPGRPAKLVQTVRCPDPIGGQTPTEPTEPPEPPDPPDPPTGGAGAHSGHGGHGSGGIGGKLGLAPPVAETDGAGLGQ